MIVYSLKLVRNYFTGYFTQRLIVCSSKFSLSMADIACCAGEFVLLLRMQLVKLWKWPVDASIVEDNENLEMVRRIKSFSGL